MSDLTVVQIPQWQGSSTPTARRLVGGARLLAKTVPDAARIRVHTEVAAGQTRDGVAHADVLVHNLAAARRAVAVVGRPVLTVGGDCAIDLAPVEAALRQHGDRLAVVWFDAHGDLNTPGSSPSGAFHGMILRALLGDGPAELTPDPALKPGQVVLAGVRALDPDERAFVDRHAVTELPPERLADPAALIDATAAGGADHVHIHIDLDVLDPTVFSSVGTPEPGGLTPETLLAAVTALAERFTVAGLTITEYEADLDAPDSHDEAILATLVPALIEAVTG
ncbi:arginase family protein [Streptomyces sp. SID3343]|uniref:arginase family protein n=1 Tax=Streptomyces sp. SID3343 TaxID=2690260 RepID=UPI0013701B27|nr:arginase family protein [Streptomyces sp. SID3343]MYW02180.1 arginase family protein [Streptomyces sp. SID3343]